MKIIKKLGFDKENDILEFNNKRSCGLWLVLIGMVLIIAILFENNFLVNPFIFLFGYYICFYIVNINKKIRKKLSQGAFSKFQIKMIYISLVLLFVLMFFIAGSFIPRWNWRLIWLGVLLATGIHFFILYYVHGKTMIFLGLICTVISILGYVLPAVPFICFGVADGITKICFGVYMLFFSNPTRIEKIK